MSGEAQLTPKQLRFVDEYLVDLNGKQAAIRAGYSPRTAAVQAYELLGIAKVADLIASRQADRSARTGVAADTVLSELCRIAFLDIAGAFREDGSLLPIHEIPEDVRRAISGVEVVERLSVPGAVTKKVRFWDKGRALEMLAKHLGLLKERVELTGKDGGPIEVAELTPQDAQRLLLARLGKETF